MPRLPEAFVRKGITHLAAKMPGDIFTAAGGFFGGFYHWGKIMFFVLFQVTAMPSSRLRSEALPAIEAYSLLTRLRRLGYQAALVVATKQQAAKYVRPVTFREWLSQCEKAIKPRNLKLNLGFVASS